MAKSIDQAKSVIRNYVKTSHTIQTALGDLKELKFLAEGGYALAYLAEWGKNAVVVKFLAEDCSSKESTRYKRFKTEFRELVQLQDTGLVASFYMFGDIETADGKYPYVIMKRYPYTLDKWIKKNPIGTLDELMPIIESLLRCLALIHSRNIIHRDIKPENIFVTDNNELVLGDFGIAWFDPEHYDRLAKTSVSDRLANFAFSAPEQFQKNVPPQPTMDLFAVGQVVQWLITGNTHRGTGRQSLSTIDASFRPLENIVDRLLQQNPEIRYQSIDEIRTALEQELKAAIPKYNDVLYGLEEFGFFLARMLPGKNGILEISDQVKIEYFLSELSKEVTKYEMWMTNDWGDLPIARFETLGNSVWLIEIYECKIENIWVNKSTTDHHCYILLECKPMESFGFHASGSETEEAAWFGDRYIARQEFDDGFADINGETVEIGGRAELRVRETTKNFWLLGAVGTSIIGSQNKNVIHQVYEFLRKNNAVNEELLIPLKRLKPGTRISNYL